MCGLVCVRLETARTAYLPNQWTVFFLLQYFTSTSWRTAFANDFVNEGPVFCVSCPESHAADSFMVWFCTLARYSAGGAVIMNVDWGRPPLQSRNIQCRQINKNKFMKMTSFRLKQWPKPGHRLWLGYDPFGVVSSALVSHKHKRQHYTQHTSLASSWYNGRSFSYQTVGLGYEFRLDGPSTQVVKGWLT